MKFLLHYIDYIKFLFVSKNVLISHILKIKFESKTIFVAVIAFKPIWKIDTKI